MSEEISFNPLNVFRLDLSSTEVSGPSGPSNQDRSTLSPSEQAIEDGKSPDAAFPWLPYPFSTPQVDLPRIDIDALQAQLQNAQHQGISQMLDNWLEGLDKVNEAHRDEEKLKIQQTLDRLFKDGANGIAPEGAQNNLQAAAAVTALILIASSVIGGVGGAAAISQPGLTAISQLSEIAISLQIVPLDASVVLGLIGALFATAAYYPTLAATLKDANGKPGQIKDGQFAKNYAAQVSRLVRSPDFEKLIRHTIILRSPESKEISSEAQTRLISVVKLILLLNAIALVYKVETGHLTGQEVAGLVNGEIELPEGDLRLPLIAQFKEALQYIPQDQRAGLLEAFLEYYDSNPALDDLLEPNAILRRQGDNRNFDRISQTGA